MPLTHSDTQDVIPAYIQPTDPGGVGADIWWLNTSVTPPVMNYRNKTNTTWLPYTSAFCLGNGLYWDADGCLSVVGISDPGSGYIVDDDGDFIITDGGDYIIGGIS